MGLLARLILGVPPVDNANTREFQHPIDERLKTESAPKIPDFPLDEDLELSN